MPITGLLFRDQLRLVRASAARCGHGCWIGGFQFRPRYHVKPTPQIFLSLNLIPICQRPESNVLLGTRPSPSSALHPRLVLPSNPVHFFFWVFVRRFPRRNPGHQDQGFSIDDSVVEKTPDIPIQLPPQHRAAPYLDSRESHRTQTATRVPAVGIPVETLWQLRGRPF